MLNGFRVLFFGLCIYRVLGEHKFFTLPASFRSHPFVLVYKGMAPRISVRMIRSFVVAGESISVRLLTTCAKQRFAVQFYTFFRSAKQMCTNCSMDVFFPMSLGHPRRKHLKLRLSDSERLSVGSDVCPPTPEIQQKRLGNSALNVGTRIFGSEPQILGCFVESGVWKLGGNARKSVNFWHFVELFHEWGQSAVVPRLQRVRGFQSAAGHRFFGEH